MQEIENEEAEDGLVEKKSQIVDVKQNCSLWNYQVRLSPEALVCTNTCTFSDNIVL